ncbi:alpha/beta hydrolase [Bailinhaonella thermotolerans]|uniref:Alpha/beta hydrolase n=2 Tax=Bailinhaonella thermotolerans TaxID=1070861 RepID=A0A3A4AD73_9ACTN|nr:alpha/beta hydrolase [Bailinhaonella thermotolerans]
MPILDVGDIAAIRALNTATPMPVHPADRDVRTSERTVPGPEGAPEVGMRVYRPGEDLVNRPAVVYFHPGLTFGTLEMDHARCMRFASGAGCVVASVDYRLAPEHPYPAGVEDCYAALCWVAANAKELGADPGRIAVAGCSTGATLAAAVALMARDRGGPELAFQLLIQPAVDDRLDTPSMAEFAEPGPCEAGRAGSAHTWRYYLAGAEAGPYAAPARAGSLRGLPPAYVSTAERDCLRDEGIAYALRLMREGVPVELHHFPGTFHAFDLVVRTAAISQRAVEEQIAVLARALAPRRSGR